MGRRKPNQVITHRVELGDWERDAVKQAAALALVPAAGVAAGVGLAGYGAYAWLTKTPLQDTIKAAEAFRNSILARLFPGSFLDSEANASIFDNMRGGQS